MSDKQTVFVPSENPESPAPSRSSSLSSEDAKFDVLPEKSKNGKRLIYIFVDSWY